MRSILNHPYPCIYDQKEKLLIAGFFGIFVIAFLLIFQPFGISEARGDYMPLKISGYGVVTFAVLIIVYYFSPLIYPNFFKEKNYTVGRELIFTVIIILLIGVASSTYSKFIIPEPYGPSMLGMIAQTFLVGIFPLSFLTIFKYNRLNKSNKKSSSEINLTKQKIEHQTIELKESNFYLISSEQEELKIATKDLLYLESDGNYVSIHQIKDGSIVKSKHRITLKSLIEQNNSNNVIRCHRSFIINLDHVMNVSGNAQGLKFTISHTDDIIPVSRKYISVVKSYWESKK